MAGGSVLDPSGFGSAGETATQRAAAWGPGAAFSFASRQLEQAGARALAALEERMSLFASTGASSGFDWGGLLGGITSGLGQWAAARSQERQLRTMNRMLRPRAMPMTFAPSGVPAAAGTDLTSVLLGGLGAAGATLLPDILPGGLEEGGTGIFGPDLFRPTASSARQRMIDAVHPGTGERVYWRPVGRPIMFAGDRALLMRTRKVLRKMSGPAGCGPAGRRAVRRRRAC